MAKRKTPHISMVGQVYLIVALFVALILVLILLVQVQIDVLMSVRAYVGAEGLWAKAQKDATRSIEQYAISKSEVDYQSYRHFIRLPLGDFAARIALQKPHPDPGVARDGFLEGGNHPEDVGYMINLFVRAQHVSYMSRAIEYWTQADRYIAELNSEAEKLHAEIVAGTFQSAEVGPLLTRLDAINQHLTEQENNFSATLAEASRRASDISHKLTYGLALLFTLLGLGISRLMIARIRATELELHRNEAELRIAATAFESKASVMITDADNVILRVNKAFEEETGYAAADVVGRNPRLLNSGQHDKVFYRAMWKSIISTGKWEGEIWDRRKNGEIYPKWLTISTVKGGDGAVSHYICSHTDITERKAAEEKIRHLAFYDPLTLLPNRRLLLDRLAQAGAAGAKSGRGAALLFIDLDDFKTLNDTHGHDVGDQLLQQVATRLESCVRDGDTVARLGGDEFVALLEGLSQDAHDATEQAGLIGQKILTALNQPYQIDGFTRRSTPSIGATLFIGYSHTVEELLKQADIAMYQAKKAGRNTIRFFNPDMQEAISTRSKIGEELREAVNTGQFRLYYQIQVNHAQQPFGAEVLVRWQHPERGLISPAEFIPVAEETGLIHPIGWWVMKAACAQIKAWQDDARTRDITLSVNVSAKQFHMPSFVDRVNTAIQMYGINPALLKLELTEGMLLENVDSAITTMSALRELGVEFALDDFGTGYSSLQYLKKLPLSQLKIDQTFVRDIVVDDSDQAIVQTIVAMARSLNLGVIAEGVETEQQRQLLSDIGCTQYQGYLFGKPVPVEAFEALLGQG
jgi:diguanylate cyclase (GGDEF)-like protein/PAS domain S-box-containing protein